MYASFLQLEGGGLQMINPSPNLKITMKGELMWSLQGPGSIHTTKGIFT
jgi:hypothetical protein